MQALKAAASEDPKLPPGSQPLPVADAYKVLGVPITASASEVKKRYMRLSLLIHPDKCGHRDAHEAFQVWLRSRSAFPSVADGNRSLALHLRAVICVIWVFLCPTPGRVQGGQDAAGQWPPQCP